LDFRPILLKYFSPVNHPSFSNLRIVNSGSASPSVLSVSSLSGKPITSDFSNFVNMIKIARLVVSVSYLTSLPNSF